jgi:hypothetical protein
MYFIENKSGVFEMRNKTLLFLLCLCLASFFSCSFFNKSSNRSGFNAGGDAGNTNNTKNNNSSASTALCPISGEWTLNGKGTDCKACPSTAVPNSDRTSCTCNTPGDRFDAAQNICENAAICTSDNTWSWHGVCTLCPTGSILRADRSGCTCPIGAYNSIDNQCPGGGCTNPKLQTYQIGSAGLCFQAFCGTVDQSAFITDVNPSMGNASIRFTTLDANGAACYECTAPGTTTITITFSVGAGSTSASATMTCPL